MEQQSIEKTSTLNSIREKLSALNTGPRGVMNQPHDKYYRTWRIDPTRPDNGIKKLRFILNKDFESNDSNDFIRSFLTLHINLGTVRVRGTGYTTDGEQFVISGKGKLLQSLSDKELMAIDKILESMGESFDDNSGIDEWSRSNI